MKRCPTCHQTFEEDWLSFCTQDGTTLIDDSSPLSAPPATLVARPVANARAANGQATLNFPSAESPSPWQPQSAAPAWQPPPPPTHIQPPNKALATAAMIVGILSVLCLGPIPAVFAIVLGGMSLSQIKKEPERVGGKQMAVTGIVTGSLAILVYGVLIVFYILMIIAGNA